MTELNPLKWQEIFSQLVEEGHYDDVDVDEVLK